MEKEFIYDASEFLSLAFTMKKITNEGNTQDYYQDILCTWAYKYNVYPVAMEYEQDSTGKLHAHGIITIRKNFLKRKLQVKGCYVYTTDIYDIEKWKRYITKGKHDGEFEGGIDNTQYMF